MKALTQWFSRPETLEICRLSTFLGVFFASRSVLSGVFVLFVQLLGYESSFGRQLLTENEILMQAICLACANFVLCALDRQSFWRAGLPWFHKGRFEVAFDLIGRKSLVGFFVASTVVLFSVFCGFAKLERPLLSVGLIWTLGPAVLSQFLSIVFWVWAIDDTRYRLWRGLVRQSPYPWHGRLFILIFETYLLFAVLCGSPHLFEKVFLALLAAALASLGLLWLEASEQEGDVWRLVSIESIARLRWFLVGIFCVYGQAQAGLSGASILHLFEGPK